MVVTTQQTRQRALTAPTWPIVRFSHAALGGDHANICAIEADPRIDSDLDGRGNPASSVPGGAGAGYGGSNATATTASHGNSGVGYDNPRSTNAGPHGSNMLNSES
jgi:hypothetical protein